MDLQAADWLDVIRREYLERYVRDGGASVKFAVPRDEEERAALRQGVRAAAEAAGYCFVEVDARTARIHLIDRLFFAIAAQIDWTVLTDGYLHRTLSAAGYRLPEGGSVRLEALASANGVAGADFAELDLDINRLLRQQLLHNYTLAYEFRLAMLRLCQARLRPEGSFADQAGLIRLWLVGELRTMSPLKPALIFQRIARHNARHMLTSLARWTHLAGRTGLAITLDIARYTEGTRPPEPDSTFYYSTAAALDVYEVLRQFVDATDELEHCFICVVAARSFLEDERRGLNRYDALRLRIWDEAHDRRRPNPLSALVRLVPAPVGAAAQRGAAQ